MPMTYQSEADRVQLEMLFSLLKRIEFERWTAAETTHPAHKALCYTDKANPGKWVIHAVTDSGMKHFGDATLLDDTQSGEVAEETPLRACAPEAPPQAAPAASSLANDWEVVRDQRAGTPSRVDALQNCMVRDPDQAASFIAEELARTNLPEDWRNALVFAAEDVTFADSTTQDRVRDRLLEIAESVRMSPKVGADKVTWSALRRVASLLEPADANLLLPFLDRKGPVDTRSVALQCVIRLFEAAPPDETGSLAALRDRIDKYARTFLDPDVFSGGEAAAIAQNAVCALAATGDPRLGEAIVRANHLQRRWLKRQLKVQLEGILKSWKAHDPGVISHAAYQVVEAQVASLQQ